MLTVFLGHTDLFPLFVYLVNNIYDPLNDPSTFPLEACPFLYSKSPHLSNQKTTLPVMQGLCSPVTEKETKLTLSKPVL